MNQKRTGIFLSYINLALGMVINLLVTPFLITFFGDVDYSIYKVIQSFAGPLAIFQLGISTIVTRSIVKCRSSEKYTISDKQNNFALAIFSSAIMALIVLLVGTCMYFIIPSVYGKTYSSESIELAKKIFIFFVLSTVFHLLTDAFSGCIIGYEQFVISAGIPLAKNILRVVLLFILLKCKFGIIAVAGVDFIISFLIFAVSVWYSLVILREIPKLIFWDKKQLREIFAFGAAILLQAIVNQVNNNVDTIILGAYINEKWIITMYSSALSIYSIYNSLVAVIQGFFLPKATKLVTQNATGNELTNFIVKPGRFQAAIAVAIIFGFALFGKIFIGLWIGEKYLNAYWIILMLIIPVTIPLVENTALAILDATLKRIFRSVVLVIMAVLNVIVSLVLINYLSYWGAAVGTVVSLIVGHGILMNFYYAKTFNMKIGKMFCSIFKGILPAGIIAFVICIPIAVLIKKTWIMLALGCMTFTVIYVVFLCIWGLTSQEKQIVKESVSRILIFKKYCIHH